jgi:hypothetical protein
VLLAAVLLSGCLGSTAGSVSSPPTHAGPSGSLVAPTPQPSQQLEPRLPAPRQETAAATLNGHLYVAGGFDAAGNDTTAVTVFDGTAWTSGPPLPIALDHPGATVAGGRLFVAGGYHGSAASAAAFVLAAAGNEWVAVAPMRQARGALALVAVSTQIYAIGGRGAAGEVASVESFDTASGAWSNVPALPVPRDHLAGFAAGNRACVAGGRSPDSSRVDCYDPGLRQWGRLPDLPQPVNGAGAYGAAAPSDVTVVAGGQSGFESRLVDRVSRLGAGGWTVETMLVPRHGFMLAALGGRLWACGGGSAPGLHPVATCTSIFAAA